MSAEAKTVRIKVRNSDPAVYHWLTPGAWKKMQLKEANRAFYVEDPVPAVPKEVAAKVAENKKLAGPKTPASDNESIATTDRLPDQNTGKIG